MIRLLCGLRIGQSQRTLPRVPATRALPHKTTHPKTRRCARVDDKTLCLSATQNAHTHKFRVATRRITARASAAPRSAAERRRLKAHVMRRCGLGKATLPSHHVAYTRAFPQQAAHSPQHARTRFLFHVSARRITARASAAAKRAQASEAVGWKRLLARLLPLVYSR